MIHFRAYPCAICSILARSFSYFIEQPPFYNIDHTSPIGHCWDLSLVISLKAMRAGATDLEEVRHHCESPQVQSMCGRQGRRSYSVIASGAFMSTLRAQKIPGIWDVISIWTQKRPTKVSGSLSAPKASLRSLLELCLYIWLAGWCFFIIFYFPNQILIMMFREVCPPEIGIWISLNVALYCWLSHHASVR